MPRLSETALNYALGNYDSVGKTGQVSTNEGEALANKTAISEVFAPDVSTAAAGDVMAYIKKEGELAPIWRSTELRLGGLYNVTISAPNNGDTVSYDSAKGRWVNSAKLTFLEAKLVSLTARVAKLEG